MEERRNANQESRTNPHRVVEASATALRRGCAPDQPGKFLKNDGTKMNIHQQTTRLVTQAPGTAAAYRNYGRYDSNKPHAVFSQATFIPAPRRNLPFLHLLFRAADPVAGKVHAV